MWLALRCSRCWRTFTGPLRFTDEVTRNAVPRGHVTAVRRSCASLEEELWVHAEWNDAWLSQEAFDHGDPVPLLHGENVRLLAGPEVVYGCCGYTGPVTCVAGHPVGELFGDCHQSDSIRLDAAAVDRSDEVDGLWDLYVIEAGAVIREVGEIAGGRRKQRWVIPRERQGQHASPLCCGIGLSSRSEVSSFDELTTRRPRRMHRLVRPLLRLAMATPQSRTEVRSDIE